MGCGTGRASDVELVREKRDGECSVYAATVR
jgi:hypothetical protein